MTLFLCSCPKRGEWLLSPVRQKHWGRWVAAWVQGNAENENLVSVGQRGVVPGSSFSITAKADVIKGYSERGRHGNVFIQGCTQHPPTSHWWFCRGIF